MLKNRLCPFVAVTVAAGCLSVLPVAGIIPAVPAGADSVPTDSAFQTQTASERAAATGEPVEVVEDRTEYTTTYANPDGTTYSLEQSAVPVRVKQASGAWAAPDTALRRLADGTVAPSATMAHLSFSGGGSTAPLVTIGDGENSISLTWPGTLPVPTLDGDSAVYADVLPGVDLRMTATVEGYRELLVVKTPTAAANPDLARIEFGLESDGVRVTPTTVAGWPGLTAMATSGSSLRRR
jgi:hypothetical protein